MSQPGQFFQKFENLDESAWTFPQNQQGKRPAAAKELNRKRPAGDRLHKALHEQNERGYLESAVWPAGRRTQIRTYGTEFNLQFKFLKLPLGSIPSK